jgi:hypothetical protein
MAGWDREILAIELQALVDLNFEVELTGFETGEVDVILDEAREATGDASGPEDENARVRRRSRNQPSG